MSFPVLHGGKDVLFLIHPRTLEEPETKSTPVTFLLLSSHRTYGIFGMAIP
jgi:hypothetical protein